MPHPPGGTVTVATQQPGSAVQITGTGTGTGIAAGHLRHIFERFYKPAPPATAPTAGLGSA